MADVLHQLHLYPAWIAHLVAHRLGERQVLGSNLAREMNLLQLKGNFSVQNYSVLMLDNKILLRLEKIFNSIEIIPNSTPSLRALCGMLIFCFQLNFLPPYLNPRRGDYEFIWVDVKVPFENLRLNTSNKSGSIENKNDQI